ncbi:uncharacterized protein LOC100843024 [Brachypodium distachyon]|uniref:SURP motif domain-containing protein n=1 Tax=Brachypodium distachyon TaxID=15368 RepID=A0A2K2DVJ5_BRADI|nr:uncharacterized protein LOC100843024 [Brachypodium distachyon]PNT78298.1 hypothetical protein BRADI_1g77182v3 [Brachypodium distachyon]|eukprot:XP_003562175.1 uncharacterized protein LOC100843024 [Brachypodium distachyon]
MEPPPLPPLGAGTVLEHRSASGEERHRIERVARFVARDRDGELAEALLLRLLRITRNGRRWGFLAHDHPLHPYYLQQKVSEQCRILRPRHNAIGR